MSFQSAPQRGKLVPALAISLILHFLLLWPTVPQPRGGEAAQPLLASLRAAAPALSPAVAKPASPPRGPRLPDTPPHAATTSESAPTAAVASGRSTVDAPLRSESFAAPVPATAGPRAPPPSSGDGLDAEGVRQYRLALATEAKRFRRYPPRAMEADIGGTVEIRIAVAAGGQPQEVKLARSSGHELLDDAALDMMKKAAPRAAVPESLRRRDFVVNLPVVFDLAGE